MVYPPQNNPFAWDPTRILNSLGRNYPVTEAGLQAAINDLPGATTRTGDARARVEYQ